MGKGLAQGKTLTNVSGSVSGLVGLDCFSDSAGVTTIHAILEGLQGIRNQGRGFSEDNRTVEMATKGAMRRYLGMAYVKAFPPSFIHKEGGGQIWRKFKGSFSAGEV